MALRGTTSRKRVGLPARLVLGALAGAAGTAAMDALQYRVARRAGLDESAWSWETAEGVSTWSEASAPGQVGEKALRLVRGGPAPDRWARRTTNVVHWATGIGWGVQYGAMSGPDARFPLLRGAVFGTTAWLTSYVVLPLAGVYEPIWRYDLETLGEDLAGHLLFGSVTAGLFTLVLDESSTD